MQAVIFGFMMPVIPLLIWKGYNRERELKFAEAAGRYVIYTLLTTLLTSLAMAVLCENTSFMEKMDKSPSFVVKYVLVSAAAVALIAAAEWVYAAGRVAVSVDWEKYAGCALAGFVKKFLFPAGLFLLAGLVAALNFVLIFDNVLWGDEAYAGGLIRNNISGIFQVLTLEENHPPLYYLWLKMFAELFGYSGPVYHLASFIPFLIGIVMAVTVFRRHFGSMPAAFFVIISGLSAPCLEYNMEIRMYELAFLGIAGSFYCAYRILGGGRVAWAGIVFWALVAAYSHYYALVAAGILLACTFAAAQIRFKGKTWLKGAVSMTVFIAAYMPWLGQLFRATNSVKGNWWMTEIESMGHSMTMLACGGRMSRVILPLLLALAIALFLAESAVFMLERKDDKYILHVTTPSVRGWAGETYAVAAGLLTIAGTLLFAYGLCVFMRPLLAVRYLYPLCSITAIVLAMGTYRILEMLKALGESMHRAWLPAVGKGALFLILAALFVMGVGDYKDYKGRVDVEKAGTEETLYLIGEGTEGMVLVNNGVQHIGWTVLRYYYPDAEVVNGPCSFTEADDFWYFTPEPLDEGDLQQLYGRGYSVADFGEQRLSKYSFSLYHMVREKTAGKATK